MVKKQEFPDNFLDIDLPFSYSFFCLPLVPFTKIYSAVVEVGSHYFSFKFRGDNYFRVNYDKKATEIAKWTKIIGSIGMFFLI